MHYTAVSIKALFVFLAFVFTTGMALVLLSPRAAL